MTCENSDESNQRIRDKILAFDALHQEMERSYRNRETFEKYKETEKAREELRLEILSRKVSHSDPVAVFKGKAYKAGKFDLEICHDTFIVD